MMAANTMPLEGGFVSAPATVPSSVEHTPPLLAANEASPEFEHLVSPSLDAADKDFQLDAPVASAQPEWHMPECWGHRGASASFPENTRMSFIEACKAGADGIETDIHVTADNVLVMFHDPRLDRTTDGTGLLHDQPWHGGLEHVRTKKAPHQPIPLFSEVLEVLMMPENLNVKLNIDCKVENDPIKLFGLIKGELEKIANWETVLAPRLVLGLWHPKFLEPAANTLPLLRRFCISMSIPQVRKYFYDKCDGFSVWYRPLASAEGARFLEECRRAGKQVCTWTVNGREEMLQCIRWGVTAVISDKPELWREVKNQVVTDRAAALKPTLQSYLSSFLTYDNWWFHYLPKAREETEYLEREGGRFDDHHVPVTLPMRPADLSI